MIFKNRPTPKNGSQKLADISLVNNKLNELWSELDGTSESAISGGNICRDPRVSTSFTIKDSEFINNKGAA